ncbi:MAG: nickel/cobalt transporter [Microcoleaceae cyanobacterium]
MHCLTWMMAIAVIFFLQTPLASAHPLGNFTINHYAGLEVTQGQVDIDYVLDMAEIPAFQEINQIDTNHNHQPEPGETVDYPVSKCQEISSSLALQIDQQPLALALRGSTVEFPPGVGGLATLRLTCQFEGMMPMAEDRQFVEFEDNSYSQRLGWREITVTAHQVPIQGKFTADSITRRLTEYPTDLLSSPLNQRQIAFEINPELTAVQSVVQPATEPIAPSVTHSPPLAIPAHQRAKQALTGRSNTMFTRLIRLEKPTLPTVLVALAIAFVWGGLHALSPGHGKTVVGAYLVGSRSNIRHALFLGLTVTLTHTAGIFALGLIVLGTSQFSLTEQLYPWLSLLSGVMVTVIGFNLLVNRLAWKLGQGSVAHVHSEHHHHHDFTHTHSHNHSHEPNHGHAHEYNHSHSHGLGHGLSHSHDHGHQHRTHSHLPPGADGSSVSWSSLLALGISGGLLPCPSALVVLLSAIAVGQIGFGLALVSAFSLGLAGVLTGIGVILVYAKERFEQLSLQVPKSNLFPAVSALMMTLIGIGITTQAWLVRTL